MLIHEDFCPPRARGCRPRGWQGGWLAALWLLACDPGLAKTSLPAKPPNELRDPGESSTANREGSPKPEAVATGLGIEGVPPTPSGEDPTGSRGQAPSPDPPVATKKVVPVRKPTALDRPKSLRAKARVSGAHEAKEKLVRQLFADADLTFPPKQMLLRAFKHESELEVWASDRKAGPVTHVATYQICAQSGAAGPKKAEGDFQVPEGFYTLNLFNRSSSYHLSMRISYPNRRDRKLGYTGSAIMIHGDCVSIGCLAMSDERVEELWVMATPLGVKKVQVHLFPGRDLDSWIAKTPKPELAAFWRNLKQGNDLFEQDHTIPKVEAEDDGTYSFR